MQINVIGRITKITGAKVLVRVTEAASINKLGIESFVASYISIGSLVGTRLVDGRILILTIDEIYDSEADIFVSSTITGIYDEVTEPWAGKSGRSDFDAASARHPDVIVVDPPRKGCDEACLSTMLQMRPDRIVYVSCDPATLARDLKLLCADGTYKLTAVTPVDQFPHSVHVETVCLLTHS